MHTNYHLSESVAEPCSRCWGYSTVSATLTHMTRSVGIRALQQNASAVIGRVQAGESVEVTDRGRPVARIVPIRGGSAVARLRDEGRVADASRAPRSMTRPQPLPQGQTLSDILAEMRADER